MHLQGQITCANVLSDMFAMGVTEIDNMLMLLGVPKAFSDKERDAIMPLIMRGFRVSEPQKKYMFMTTTGLTKVMAQWLEQ